MTKLSLALKEEAVFKWVFRSHPSSFPKLRRTSRLFSWRMTEDLRAAMIKDWGKTVLYDDTVCWEQVRLSLAGRPDQDAQFYCIILYDGYLCGQIPRYSRAVPREMLKMAEQHALRTGDSRILPGQFANWQIDDIWPLFQWLEQNKVQGVFDLIEKKKYGDEGYTLLQKAVSQRLLAVVKLLLGSPKDNKPQRPTFSPSKKGAFGYTPLIEACYQGHVGIVSVLLERKADCDCLSKNGSTAMLVAAREGHAEVVAELCKWGGDPEDGGDKGWSPLQVAAGEGHVTTCQILIECKANVDGFVRTGDEERSSLQEAAEQGQIQVVELLLAYKANPNHWCSDHKTGRPVTALDLARASRHEHVEQLLLAAGAAPP